MSTKYELARSILAELAIVRSRPPKPFEPPKGEFRLPPTLPIGDGRWIQASDKLLQMVDQFGHIIFDQDRRLATSVTRSEIRALVRRAFGQALERVDFDLPIDDNCQQLLAAVAGRVTADLEATRTNVDLVFGCTFLSDSSVEDYVVGPARFEARARWLTRLAAEQRISKVTERRIRAAWSGRRVGNRKPSLDQTVEHSVLGTIGDASFVCSVRAPGLAPKVAEQKALLVARLALTAVALIWHMPSRALDGMYLTYDSGPTHRVYAAFSDVRFDGASWSLSRLPSGPHVSEDWAARWSGSDWLVDPVAAALFAFIDPAATSERPRILNALFLSLWWFHEACRERTPLMATVKFAASLDALANGKKRKGIRQLLEARLQLPDGAALTRDGRTADDVAGEIYDFARSRTIHGSNDRLGDDYADTRVLAETIAAIGIRSACRWIHDNPASDDLDALRRR